MGTRSTPGLPALCILGLSLLPCHLCRGMRCLQGVACSVVPSVGGIPAELDLCSSNGVKGVAVAPLLYEEEIKGPTESCSSNCTKANQVCQFEGKGALYRDQLLNSNQGHAPLPGSLLLLWQASYMPTVVLSILAWYASLVLTKCKPTLVQKVMQGSDRGGNFLY
jgi:hypothetical protein